MRQIKFIIVVLGLLFYSAKTVMADSDMVHLVDTTHSYTGNDGSFSIDGNWNTFQSANNEGGNPSQSIVISEHMFASPCTLTSITYRMSSSTIGYRGYGLAPSNSELSWSIEYYKNGNWHQIVNDSPSADTAKLPYQNNTSWGNTNQLTINGDSDKLTIVVNIPGCLGIRATCSAQIDAGQSCYNGHCSRTYVNSSVKIYDLQVLGNIDVGLRAYDGTGITKIVCEPLGGLISPLKVSKNNIIYSVVLVDPSDSGASKIEIETESGIKALKKYD